MFQTVLSAKILKPNSTSVPLHQHQDATFLYMTFPKAPHSPVSCLLPILHPATVMWCSFSPGQVSTWTLLLHSIYCDLKISSVFSLLCVCFVTASFTRWWQISLCSFTSQSHTYCFSEGLSQRINWESLNTCYHLCRFALSFDYIFLLCISTYVLMYCVETL